MISIPVKCATPDTGKDFILDISVPRAWCLTSFASQYTDKVLHRLVRVKAFVPDCWSLQLAEALHGGERQGLRSSADVNRFLNGLGVFPIFLDDETPVRVWPDTLSLARTHLIPVSDAAYLELALRLHLPVATIDASLTRAAAAAGVPLFAP